MSGDPGEAGRRSVYIGVRKGMPTGRHDGVRSNPIPRSVEETMAQRKLRLEELEVDSFEVLPETPKERGTVRGHAATVTVQLNTCYDVTCRYVRTCAYTCGDTCQG